MSSAAVPQRPHSGVVQPQNSMTEALPTINMLLNIDRTARSIHASNERARRSSCSWSWTSTSASTGCAAETNASAQLERAALRRPAFSSARRRVPAVHSLNPELSRQGGERQRLHSRMCRLRAVPRRPSVFPTLGECSRLCFLLTLYLARVSYRREAYSNVHVHVHVRGMIIAVAMAH